jgi:integrase
MTDLAVGARRKSRGGAWCCSNQMRGPRHTHLVGMTTRALTPSEILLLSQALEARRRHRDRLFLLLAVTTGFRVSELLTLRFSQLLTPTSQVAKEITVARRALKGGHGPRAKTVRSRRVPLNETARSAVETYLATLPEPPTGEAFVFSSRNGDNRPITRCQAYMVMKTLAREAGLDASRVGCHSTRKTYARGLYEASGRDLIKTQRLLGHTNPMTTARYLDTSQEELDTLVLGFNPLSTMATPPWCA